MEDWTAENRLLASTKANLPSHTASVLPKVEAPAKVKSSSAVTFLSATAGLDLMGKPNCVSVGEDNQDRDPENQTKVDTQLARDAENFKFPNAQKQMSGVGNRPLLDETGVNGGDDDDAAARIPSQSGDIQEVNTGELNSKEVPENGYNNGQDVPGESESGQGTIELPLGAVDNSRGAISEQISEQGPVDGATFSGVTGNSDVEPIDAEDMSISREETGGSDDEFGDFAEPESPGECVGGVFEAARGNEKVPDAARSSQFSQGGPVTSKEEPAEKVDDDDDDFGDFGDFAAAESTATMEPKQLEISPSNDDFGDFGDFSEAQTALKEEAGMGSSGSHLLESISTMRKDTLLSIVKDLLAPILHEGYSDRPEQSIPAAAELKGKRFRLPSESALGANLLTVKPMPPGFLRGCGPPAVLAARVANIEQKLLRSLDLLDAFTRASVEERLMADPDENGAGSGTFQGMVESGSLSSLQETPRISDTASGKDSGGPGVYDLDFLVQASAGSGVLPQQVKSDLSFSSAGDGLQISTPPNSCGSPSSATIRHQRDLSSIFDNLADLAPMIPNAAEAAEEAGPPKAEVPGEEPLKPKVTIEPVKSLDMWGMGDLTTLEEASARAAEAVSREEDDFLDFTQAGTSNEIERAMQGSILPSKSESNWGDFEASASGAMESDTTPPNPPNAAGHPTLEETGSGSKKPRHTATLTSDFGSFVGGELAMVAESIPHDSPNSLAGVDLMGVEKEPDLAISNGNLPHARRKGSEDMTQDQNNSLLAGFDNFVGDGSIHSAESSQLHVAKEHSIDSSLTPTGGLEASSNNVKSVDNVEPLPSSFDRGATESESIPAVGTNTNEIASEGEWGGFESSNVQSSVQDVQQKANEEQLSNVCNPVPPEDPSVPEPDDLFTDDWLLSLKGNKQAEESTLGQEIPQASTPNQEDGGGGGGGGGEDWGDFSQGVQADGNGEGNLDPFGFVSAKFGVSAQAPDPPKVSDPKKIAMKDLPKSAPRQSPQGTVLGVAPTSSSPLELFDGLDMPGLAPAGTKESEQWDNFVQSMSSPGVENSVKVQGNDDDWGGFQGM